MYFDLQLLGKPDATDSADVMEDSTLAAESVEDVSGRRRT
jgi:hypothetical protein